MVRGSLLNKNSSLRLQKTPTNFRFQYWEMGDDDHIGNIVFDATHENVYFCSRFADVIDRGLVGSVQSISNKFYFIIFFGETCYCIETNGERETCGHRA